MPYPNLTPDEEAARVALRNQLQAIAESHDAPADRPKTEHAIRGLYEVLGDTPPPFIWCRGPYEGAYIAALLKAPDDLIRQAIGEYRETGVLTSHWPTHLPLGDFDAETWAQIVPVFRDEVKHSLGLDISEVEARGAILLALGHLSPDSLTSAAQDYSFGGALGYWTSLYESFRQAGMPMDESEEHKLALWLELSLNGGWWIPLNRACICVEKDECFKMRDGRLHCEDGPAIKRGDGSDVYAWNGVEVPKAWIIERDSVPIADAITWPNIEQRRCLQEILGWAKVLEQLDAKVIDEDSDPEVGTLVEVDLPDDGPSRFIRVRCATGRTFAICVPMEMQTALEANAWTYNIPSEFVRNRAFRA